MRSALLALCVAGLAAADSTVFTDQQCRTRLGASQVANVPTNFQTVNQATATATEIQCAAVVRTITPAASTFTTTNTLTTTTVVSPTQTTVATSTVLGAPPFYLHLPSP